MKKFALIGAGGYIAPRHLQAIKETGNQLVAAMDVTDSVGVLDSYFPEAAFFTDEARFVNFLNDQRAEKHPVDYLTICSPNHLHEEHILLGLKAGLDVVCEKPVALYSESVSRIAATEKECGRKVYTIMQLRLHPSIQALKRKIDGSKQGAKHIVDVKYITARGKWYHESWKGDVQRSGGIATNIGIHLFDLLLLLFGDVQESIVTNKTAEKMTGQLELEHATVNWFLCIDEGTLPEAIRLKDKRVYRSFRINDEDVDFSEGSLNLHTESYRAILSGNGFRLADTLPSLELVTTLRNQPVTVLSNI